ncbi:hypothetical protein CRUP_003947 [Coryphaenoides rupestris]|nr:hypothetical protein CRUP_003947 [Coryphaenoides rupestris]
MDSAEGLLEMRSDCLRTEAMTVNVKIESKTRALACCAGCRRSISERFLMRVNGCSWHEQCVRCAACRQPLRNTCYCRDTKLYCKVHYQQ